MSPRHAQIAALEKRALHRPLDEPQTFPEDALPKGNIMQVVITAIGPDNRGLADPIVHFVTGSGANIHEIQMYDHDSEQLFAMLLRIEWPGPRDSIPELRKQMDEIGRHQGPLPPHLVPRRGRPAAAGWRSARPTGPSPRGPSCRRSKAAASRRRRPS